MYVNKMLALDVLNLQPVYTTTAAPSVPGAPVHAGALPPGATLAPAPPQHVAPPPGAAIPIPISAASAAAAAVINANNKVSMVAQQRLETVAEEQLNVIRCCKGHRCQETTELEISCKLTGCLSADSTRAVCCLS